MRSTNLTNSLAHSFVGTQENLPVINYSFEPSPGSIQGTLLIFDKPLPQNVDDFIETYQANGDSGLNSRLNKVLGMEACGAIGVSIQVNPVDGLKTNIVMSEAANTEINTAYIKTKFDMPSGNSGFLQTNTTLTAIPSLDLTNIEWTYPDYVHAIAGDDVSLPTIANPKQAIAPGIITPRTEAQSALKYNIYAGIFFSGGSNFQYGRTMIEFKQPTLVNRLLFNFKQGSRASYVVNIGRTSDNTFRTGFWYKLGTGAWQPIIALNTRMQSTQHTGYHLIEFPEVECDAILFSGQPASGNAVQGVPCYFAYNHFAAGYTPAVKQSGAVTPTFALLVPNIENSIQYASDKNNKFLGEGGGSPYALFEIGEANNQVQLNKLSYDHGQSHRVSLTKPIVTSISRS